jgi:hypothetical protein
MTTEDWGFINDLLDVLVFRLGEQDRRIQHLEEQVAQLLKDNEA